jgi:predicted MFS family arabinose efflux permease
MLVTRISVGLFKFHSRLLFMASFSRSFRHLAWSNLAAQSAEQLSLTATPMLAVLVLGAGPGEIGLLATVQTLPFFLLAIPMGLLADRTSRRRLMIASEVLRTVSLVGLFLLALTPWLSITSLAALGFLGALGTVGFSVGAPALLPGLVASDSLARANGRLELARSIAYAAGPALAGALVSWAGASFAFALATILSLTAVILLLRIIEPSRVLPVRRHPMLELKEGIRLVWCDDLLRPVLLTAVVWNMSWFILQAAYVPYAVAVLGLSATGVGLTLAAYGFGMVVGALLAARVVASLTFGQAIVIGPAVSVLAAALMLLTLAAPTGVLASLSFFLFGAGPIIWTITSSTLRQTITPKAMLGRVSALFLTVNMGARPFGAAIGGLVGAGWGEAACLQLAGLGFLIQAVIIVVSAARSLRHLPASVS